MLAEIRQQQNRWDEAIVHWQQVARIRALEPTGLLKLAEAQIHQQLWDDADATVRQLESRTWPSRFATTRVWRATGGSDQWGPSRTRSLRIGCCDG